MSDSANADGAATAGPSIRVLRGDPTDEELAALIAVVGGAYLAEVSEPPTAPPARSRWNISARGLRRPLERERGFGGFSG